MRFENVDARFFDDFHRSFQGDTEESFEVCARCGGACEFNKIGTLMPGEREYMASIAGLSTIEFSSRYLDVLVMDDGMELDVLRLVDGCPFLSRRTYECQCRSYKVVLCEIFPIGFRIERMAVHFELDEWCPLSDTERFRNHFLTKGVPAIQSIPVPREWYEYVSLYDDLYFDYDGLQNCGRDPGVSERFSLAELLSFQRRCQSHDPKERFHPHPNEVIRPNTGRVKLPIVTGRATAG